MRNGVDRWGERTICRVEIGKDDESGLELILRMKGDPRRVEREYVILFMEQVIQLLYGQTTELKGTFRIVDFGKEKMKIKPAELTELQRDMLRNVVFGLYERLNLKGRRELAHYITVLLEEI